VEMGVQEGGGEGREGDARTGTTHHLATTTGIYPHTYNFPVASAVDICTCANFKVSFNGRPNTAPGGGGTYSCTSPI
jgi:hypothetical protein